MPRKVNWKRVFEGAPRSFNRSERGASNMWDACALSETQPKLAKKLCNSLGREFSKEKDAAGCIERALMNLSLLFPILVDGNRFVEARRVYNTMRTLVGKKTTPEPNAFRRLI